MGHSVPSLKLSPSLETTGELEVHRWRADDLGDIELHVYK